jgi:hypothetical protein
LASEHNRFQTVRRGYDPAAVERELISINSELVRLQSQNADLAASLKQTRQQLAQAETELAGSRAPNYSTLGAKAADLLITAESIALELSQQTELDLEEQRLTTASELEELQAKAEASYQEQLQAATRRSARALATARHEAELLLAQATQKAEAITKEVEREAAKLRGLAATEVAAIKSNAVREIELRKAEAEKEIAQQKYLLAESFGDEQHAEELAKSKLEAVLSERNRQAEAEFSQKHGEAVRQTEQYLESAKQDLSELQQSIALSRLEIQTLEMDAGNKQARLFQEAREKAEALVHAAELEATELKLAAQKEIAESQKEAKIALMVIENRVAASEIYLKNLRSVVLDQGSSED